MERRPAVAVGAPDAGGLGEQEGEGVERGRGVDGGGAVEGGAPGVELLWVRSFLEQQRDLVGAVLVQPDRHEQGGLAVGLGQVRVGVEGEQQRHHVALPVLDRHREGALRAIGALAAGHHAKGVRERPVLLQGRAHGGQRARADRFDEVRLGLLPPRQLSLLLDPGAALEQDGEPHDGDGSHLESSIDRRRYPHGGGRVKRASSAGVP
jgi:hypothetical protein